MRTNEIKNEMDEIKNWEETIKEKDLKYETNKYRFGFQQSKTIGSFGDSIYNGKINIKEAKKKQNNLLKIIVNSNNKSRPKPKEDNEKNKILLII